MTDSLVLVQINESPDGAFHKPLLRNISEQLPSVVSFDFDNFSEETIRQYAIDLLRQSKKGAVVVEARAKEGPFTGLVQFLNRLQQLKHPQLLLVQQGDLPPQLEKMMKVIGGSNFRNVNSLKETEDLVLSFLDNGRRS